MSRRLVPLAAVALAVALLPACSTAETDPTVRWFDGHRRQLELTRKLLETDGAQVSSLSYAHMGQPSGIAGAKEKCSAYSRNGDLPWTCSDGQKRGSYAEIEAFVGVPPGRIEAYRAIGPANVHRAGECDPPGSFAVTLADPDSYPCVGRRNLLWSPTPAPVRSKAGICGDYLPMDFVPLAGGWYREVCAGDY
jgi:hypothetical protein